MRTRRKVLEHSLIPERLRLDGLGGFPLAIGEHVDEMVIDGEKQLNREF